VTLRNLYVIARTAAGRPTLQHKLVDGTSSRTDCNRDISSWSRAYMHKPIEQILCRHCKP
jgi:hypothetical protein